MEPTAPRAHASIDGRTIELIDHGPLAGDAPHGLPAVLLHGLGRALGDWLPSVHGLARARRVIVPDIAALHSAGSAHLDLPAIAAQIVAVLAARGVARAHWVGNSLGGHVAITAATDTPDACAAVVLVNAVIPHTRLGRVAVPVREVFTADDPVLAALGTFAPRPGPGRVWLPRGGHLPQRDAPDLLVPALCDVLAALDAVAG